LKRFLLVILGLLLGAQGCGVSDEAKRAEVASVTVAIDRLRDAPNANKAAFLTSLKQTPCSLPDVCQLRDLCVAAYTKLVDSRAQIAQLKATEMSATEIAAKSQTVQAQLSQAYNESKRCVDVEVQVLDHYRAKATN
jgi:hypothetical protein